jgi:hypothetical protein
MRTREKATCVDKQSLNLLKRESRDLGVAEDDEDEADKTDTSVCGKKKEFSDLLEAVEIEESEDKILAEADPRALLSDMG